MKRFFLISVEILLSVVTIKLMYLLWKKDLIFEFLFDPIIVHATADTETFDHVNKEITKFMKFIHSYMVMFPIAFIFYVFSTLPMFSDGRKLPFFIKYTFVGNYSEIIYWIAYVFVISEILFGFACSLTNAIIWYILFNYSIEYKVIGHQLRNLGIKKLWANDPEPWNVLHPSIRTTYNQDLIGLIRSHQNIFQ